MGEVVAAGLLSHVPSHMQPEAKRSCAMPQRRVCDEMIIDFLKQGRHAAVIDVGPEFRGQCGPEGVLAHYSVLSGALGGKSCKVVALQYGAYDSAIGTGHVLLWFPL